MHTHHLKTDGHAKNLAWTTPSSEKGVTPENYGGDPSTHVSVPARKRNFVPKYGNAQQDVPASKPEHGKINPHRKAGNNSGKVR